MCPQLDTSHSLFCSLFGLTHHFHRRRTDLVHIPFQIEWLWRMYSPFLISILICTKQGSHIPELPEKLTEEAHTKGLGTCWGRRDYLKIIDFPASTPIFLPLTYQGHSSSFPCSTTLFPPILTVSEWQEIKFIKHCGGDLRGKNSHS